jgi:NDP-sugar pyrophosphorylase family protein
VDAIILAAGEGARLKGWTSDKPKGMITLGNAPILEHIVQGLSKSGIQKINMVVGYRKNLVMSYFGDGSKFGIKINYIEQSTLSGTLDALKLGLKDISNHFILVPGDNYISSSSFLPLISNEKPVLLAGKADRWSKWGEIEFVGSKAKITFDNPEAFGRLHFTGIMKLDKDIAENLISADGRHIGEALQKIEEDVNFDVIRSDYWHNIVYPWDLIDGNRLALQNLFLSKSGKIERNVTLKGPISIGSGSVICSGSYLEGPISIGDNCVIGPNTFVGSSVSIGDNTRIGAFCEIKDSILMSDSVIGSYNSIVGTVVGNGTETGTNVIANPSNRQVTYLDHTVSLSNRGSMIGNRCNIGNRAVLDGGSILLEGATIGEGEVYNADFQGDTI